MRCYHGTLRRAYFAIVHCETGRGLLFIPAPGESVDIAEEMAALQSLRNLFRMDDARKPLILSDKLRESDADLLASRGEQPKASEWTSEKIKKLRNIVEL